MVDVPSGRSGDPAVPEQDAATGRALVPLTPAPARGETTGQAARPDARFVAHLIAMATHAPQTRSLRRAASGDVMTTYSGASRRTRLPAAASGSALSRLA